MFLFSMQMRYFSFPLLMYNVQQWTSKDFVKTLLQNLNDFEATVPVTDKCGVVK